MELKNSLGPNEFMGFWGELALTKKSTGCQKLSKNNKWGEKWQQAAFGMAWGLPARGPACGRALTLTQMTWCERASGPTQPNALARNQPSNGLTAAQHVQNVLGLYFFP